MAEKNPELTKSKPPAEITNGEISPPPASNYALDISNVNKPKTLRKMDLRIIPIVTVLYLFSFLDRGNIGNARILGMEKDLRLIGNQYSLCLTCFFFPYCALEIPSNILLKKLKPSIWLPTIMVAWGLVTLCMGFVQNYHGLLIARIFLGAAEAGLFPGVAYYLTFWYAPEELAFRQGIFFSAASAAGGFSGLLAYAINKMNGIGGYAGWRWIFIMEGAVTIAVAFVAFFLLHDSPETAKFLTPEEKAWAIERVKYSAQGRMAGEVGKAEEVTEKLQWKYIKAGLTDWQIWLAIPITWGSACPLYGISFFLPTIVNQLGYTANTANLLTIPAYVAGATATVLVAWLSDRCRVRYPFVLAMQLVLVVGFLFAIGGSAVGGGTKYPGLRYAGCFLVTMGCYPYYIVLLVWMATNVSPTYKRGATMALQIGFGNLGGAMASNFYRPRDSPGFVFGHGIEIGFVLLALCCGLVLRYMYHAINKRRDEDVNAAANYTESELAAMGDRAPTFRYNY